MGSEDPSALTLDTGALIAIENGDERIRALMKLAKLRQVPIYVPAPVVSEAWRGGSGQQVRLASFFKQGQQKGQIRIVDLDYPTALQVGVLWSTVQAGNASATDVIVAWCVRKFGGVVLTSDPSDLQHFLPERLIQVI